jgi:hypothetical protein
VESDIGPAIREALADCGQRFSSIRIDTEATFISHRSESSALFSCVTEMSPQMPFGDSLTQSLSKL